ncbi:MAG: hypothetical protein VB035_02535 [Candidatus Fimivivens sp.]|nr:hypothetical protein [Candidatus Fimivivens sp.]
MSRGYLKLKSERPTLPPLIARRAMRGECAAGTSKRPVWLTLDVLHVWQRSHGRQKAHFTLIAAFFCTCVGHANNVYS